MADDSSQKPESLKPANAFAAFTDVEFSGGEPQVTRDDVDGFSGGAQLNAAAAMLAQAAEALKDVVEQIGGGQNPFAAAEAATEMDDTFTFQGPSDSRTLPEKAQPPGVIKEEWEESLIGRFEEYQIASRETQDKIVSLLDELIADQMDLDRRLNEMTTYFERQIR